jgi:hypothetical protein
MRVWRLRILYGSDRIATALSLKISVAASISFSVQSVTTRLATPWTLTRCPTNSANSPATVYPGTNTRSIGMSTAAGTVLAARDRVRRLTRRGPRQPQVVSGICVSRSGCDPYWRSYSASDPPSLFAAAFFLLELATEAGLTASGLFLGAGALVCFHLWHWGDKVERERYAIG